MSARARTVLQLCLALLSILALIAGWTAPHIAPDYALNSNLIYRLEIAAAVFAIELIFLRALWMAWYGKTVFGNRI